MAEKTKKTPWAALTTPAKPKRAPASDVMAPRTEPLGTHDWAYIRSMRHGKAERQRLGEESARVDLAEYAGPAFYDPAKLNAVRQARGGEALPWNELQPKPAPPSPPAGPPAPARGMVRSPGGQFVDPRLLGGGLSFGPAAAEGPPRPPGPPPVAFAGELIQDAPPMHAPAPKLAAAAKSVSGPPAWAAMSTRAPGEVGSAGVMTDRARARGLQEAGQLQGVPEQLRKTVERQVLAGDYSAPARAQSAWEALNPVARMPGRESTAAAYISDQVVAGGQGVRDKQAADRAKYSANAAANADQAKKNSWAALDKGLNPLASPQQVRKEQERRNRLAYQESDVASLQKLAAAGDQQAAEALRGGTMPGFVGPVQGVRAREADAARALADETQKRQESALRIRYEIPERIRQETAQVKEQGLDRRAWMKADPKTGKAQSFSYDQILRTWQTAMKAHEHANGEIDTFPGFFAWAQQQGFQVGTAPAQAAPSIWNQMLPGILGNGGGAPGGAAPANAGAVPVGGMGQAAGGGYPPPAALSPQELARWSTATPEQQERFLRSSGLLR